MKLTRVAQHACIAGLLASFACSREKADAPSTSLELASAKLAGAAGTPSRAPGVVEQPIELLSLPVSAYHPTLRLADDAIYLLAEHAAYRLAPGRAPQKFDLELGVGATLTASSIVYWSKGAVVRAPKLGGAPERVLALAESPQYFVAAGSEFAWLAHAASGAFSIQIPAGKQVKTLLAPAGDITALVMLQDWAFFVEASGSTWRVGGVREPGKAKYTAAKSGRPPSMLATAGDALYYYDGERSEIVKLSPDLQTEEEWVKGVICSPIAVASAAYCGSVEGLYSVSQQRPEPRMLAINAKSLVTAIAADATRVAWIRDTGPDKLAVQMLNIPDR